MQTSIKKMYWWAIKYTKLYKIHILVGNKIYIPL